MTPGVAHAHNGIGLTAIFPAVSGRERLTGRLSHPRCLLPARAGLARAGRQLRGQVVQVTPFTENDVGEASLLAQVPWKPSEVEPPAAIVAL